MALPKKGKGSRRSRQEWRSLLAEFNDSDLGIEAFCRREAISADRHSVTPFTHSHPIQFELGLSISELPLRTTSRSCPQFTVRSNERWNR